jgi:predicted PurR-regulated permease PerM
VAQVAEELYGILLPLGVAAVVAFIVEPLIGLIAGRWISRLWAVIIVGVLAVGVVGGIGAVLAPKIVDQVISLARDLPEAVAWGKGHLLRFSQTYPEAQGWIREQAHGLIDGLPAWLQKNIGALIKPLGQFWSGLGLALGFMFVPIYVFYFLVEKEKIERHWREYVPLREWWVGREVVFVIEQVHGYLVAFFRGQVVVALFVGVAMVVGLSLIGLPYGILIGMLCGVLSIVPYLGVVLTIVPALVIAWVNTEHWVQPSLVLVVFSTVQMLEGFFVSPKVMGNRTGLHPLTVIIAILVWSQILPGLLGAILAIPLTATLRVLLYRYVWCRVVPEIGGSKP